MGRPLNVDIVGNELNGETIVTRRADTLVGR